MLYRAWPPLRKSPIGCDSNGQSKADTELRDPAITLLPFDVALPLPIGYEKNTDNAGQLRRVTA